MEAPTILMTINFSTVWNQGAWYLQLFFFSILLWLFVIFCVSIQIFGLFTPVLWKMLCVFWQELHLENSIEFADCFWWYGHFNNITSSNPWAQYIFSCICAVFHFFLHHLMVFRSFSSFVKLTPKYLFNFYPIVNGVVFFFL